MLLISRGLVRLFLSLAIVVATFACGRSPDFISNLESVGFRRISANSPAAEVIKAGGFSIDSDLTQGQARQRLRLKVTNHDNDAVLDCGGQIETVIAGGSRGPRARSDGFSFRDILPHQTARRSAHVAKPGRVAEHHLPLPLQCSHFLYSGRERHGVTEVTIDAKMAVGRQRAILQATHQGRGRDGASLLNCEGRYEALVTTPDARPARRSGNFSIRDVAPGSVGSHSIGASDGARFVDLRLLTPVSCWYSTP